MIQTKQLLERLRKVMNEVSAEKGEFILFGYFLREEAIKWDLVLSAYWLEEGLLKGLNEFVAKLTSIVGKEALLAFRIITVDPDDPRLHTLLKEVQVENGLLELRDATLFDMEMERAYILQAKRPAEATAKAA